jgi:hypothetical protein
MATQQLQLDYAPPDTCKDIFTLPYPSREVEFRPLTPTGFTAHRCGLSGGHWVLCEDPSRCCLPMRFPCGPCLAAVEASYRPGRYCSR